MNVMGSLRNVFLFDVDREKCVAFWHFQIGSSEYIRASEDLRCLILQCICAIYDRKKTLSTVNNHVETTVFCASCIKELYDKFDGKHLFWQISKSKRYKMRRCMAKRIKYIFTFFELAPLSYRNFNGEFNSAIGRSIALHWVPLMYVQSFQHALKCINYPPFCVKLH